LQSIFKIVNVEGACCLIKDNNYNNCAYNLFGSVVNKNVFAKVGIAAKLTQGTKLGGVTFLVLWFEWDGLGIPTFILNSRKPWLL
jgi:hypothetical protein